MKVTMLVGVIVLLEILQPQYFIIELRLQDFQVCDLAYQAGQWRLRTLSLVQEALANRR